MTREDAIKVLRTESVEISGNAVSVCRFWEALDMAVKALEDVTDKNVGKWISVKDRLPEPGVNVLARCFYHECWQMFVCYLSKRNPGEWYTGISGQWVQVTHWMPLPEKPKEGTV